MGRSIAFLDNLDIETIRARRGWLLHVVLDPDQDDDEVGYLEVRWTLERIETDGSYCAVARGLPNLTRQTLMNIHKNSQRRRWYLEYRS